MNKDSLKIKIIYNSKNLTVEIQRNKPFKILREKTQSFFFPLPQYYSSIQIRSIRYLQEGYVKSVSDSTVNATSFAIG